MSTYYFVILIVIGSSGTPNIIELSKRADSLSDCEAIGKQWEGRTTSWRKYEYVCLKR